MAAAKRQERLDRLRSASRRLGLAWLLASACLLHHGVHWLGPAAPGWLKVFCSTPAHATLSALALLGAPRLLLPRLLLPEGCGGLCFGQCPLATRRASVSPPHPPPTPPRPGPLRPT